MPIIVEDPDGRPHEFADGTPDAVINAQMEQRWASRGQPKPQTGPQLSSTPGTMPPGTAASRLQPQEGAPDANMVPLSAEAEQAKRLMLSRAVRGDRAGVQGAYDLMKVDPTYQAREKQAQKMGENAADLAARQTAGTRIIPGIKSLVDMVQKVPDADWEKIGGAYNTVKMPPRAEVPLSIASWSAPEMTPTQARAAFGPFASNADYQRHWAMQNQMDHLIEALTEQNVGAGNKNVGGSDARMELVKSLLHKALAAPNKEAARAVLEDAEHTTRSIYGLPQADKAAHGAPPPAAGSPPAPAPSRPRAQNPKTGEVIEWNGREWQKVN